MAETASNSAIEPNKLAEIQSAEAALSDPLARTKPFHPDWGGAYWIKWGAIDYALRALSVPLGSHVLDVAAGAGWTSLFLAEAGYRVTGLDIAPAKVQLASERAERWQLESTRFVAADMDTLDLGEQFDAALVFDGLHHSARQARVVTNVSRHLRRGAWVIFGEPSLLHAISPHARQVQRESGWIERGIGVRRLKRDCAAAGLGNFRRFFEGVGPYESRTKGFAWSLAKLVAANVLFAPQTSVWLAAQKVD